MKKENIIFKNEKVTEINRSKMSTLRLWEQLNDGEWEAPAGRGNWGDPLAQSSLFLHLNFNISVIQIETVAQLCLGTLLSAIYTA